MNRADLFGILGGIVTVALVTAFVQSPNTANVIKAGGNAFRDSIRAALGK